MIIRIIIILILLALLFPKFIFGQTPRIEDWVELKWNGGRKSEVVLHKVIPYDSKVCIEVTPDSIPCISMYDLREGFTQ